MTTTPQLAGAAEATALERSFSDICERNRLRAFGASAVSMLVGFFLGMCFPAGLRWVDRSSGAPAALASNGVTGVLGSVAALIISVAWGIPSTLMLGGVCYAIAGLCGPHRWREVPQ